MRCSDEIFKQLSQNYLKFRNTRKFCLDNLVGFDPDELVAPADMLELDTLGRHPPERPDREGVRLATTTMSSTPSPTPSTTSASSTCSSFYFDIIKDRLYCDGADSLSRRSAQTALFLILDTMTKMFAPILAFTCDEIWLAMPHRASDDGRNVLLNEMSKPYTAYALSEDEMTKWARIAAVRNVVNGALEQARADKTIGKSLEAEVDLVVPHEDVFLAEMDPAALADTLLVSQVRVAEGDEPERRGPSRERLQVLPLLEGAAHRRLRRRTR